MQECPSKAPPETIPNHLAQHSGSKGVNLETKNPESYGGRTVPMGWMAVGYSVANGLSGIPGDLPDVSSLTRHGEFVWWTFYPHNTAIYGQY